VSDRTPDEGTIDSAIELTTTLLTAYIKHVNTHRHTSNAAVVTAISTLNAAVVDVLTHKSDDRLAESVLTIIKDTSMTALSDRRALRMLLGSVAREVLGRHR
jgi:uncharacterized lipoprotein YajG